MFSTRLVLPSWRLLPLCLISLATIETPTSASAQGASIEELEQRLQKAKEDKARRDAAAAKAKPAAPANSGRLVVEVDAACELRVNGERLRSFNAADTAVITVSAGEQLIECVSAAIPGAKARKVVEVSSGKQVVLSLSVLEVEGSSRAAEAKLQRERRETEARARAEADARVECDRGGPSMMQVTGNQDVLRQCGSEQLLWTRADNGRDVNWSQAQAHCQGLGSGWSLPTVTQLQSLYDKNLPGIRCGEFTCRVSNQFRLSHVWFWSSESSGSSEAWNVVLDGGSRDSARVRYSGNDRALCVRRP